MATALRLVHKDPWVVVRVNAPVMAVIVFMSHSLCPHCNESSRIFPGNGGEEERRRLGVTLLGQIYLSPEIAQSADSGNPYVLNYKDSPITAEYMKIANHIAELTED
jgi:ATP-binding protein involved in chromosome partitioning